MKGQRRCKCLEALLKRFDQIGTFLKKPAALNPMPNQPHKSTQSMKTNRPILRNALLLVVFASFSGPAFASSTTKREHADQPPSPAKVAEMTPSNPAAGTGRTGDSLVPPRFPVHQRVEEAPTWTVPFGQEFWRRPAPKTTSSPPYQAPAGTNTLPANFNLGEVVERVAHAFQTEGSGAVVNSRTYTATVNEHGLHFSPRQFATPASSGPDGQAANARPAKAGTLNRPLAEALFCTQSIRRGDQVLY